VARLARSARLHRLQTVDFNISQGSSGELILDDPGGFNAPITGFRGTDIIDLKGLAYSIPTSTVLDSTHTSATVGAETISLSMTATQTIITVTEGGTTATIDLLGNYAGHSFTFSSDGSGGTQFVDPLAIYSGNTLELPGASADNVLFVNNAGISGTLVLDDAAAFSGQVSGFTGTGTVSDAIDLKGIAFDSDTKWTYTPNSLGTGGALTIYEGATVVIPSILPGVTRLRISRSGAIAMAALLSPIRRPRAGPARLWLPTISNPLVLVR